MDSERITRSYGFKRNRGSVGYVCEDRPLSDPPRRGDGSIYASWNGVLYLRGQAIGVIINDTIDLPRDHRTITVEEPDLGVVGDDPYLIDWDEAATEENLTCVVDGHMYRMGSDVCVNCDEKAIPAFEFEAVGYTDEDDEFPH